MADVKISELPALTSPDGAEELVVNDGGTTKKITITNATSAALPKAGGTMTGALLSTSNFTANSTSSGDYVRMYGSSGTGKWDIYGNGANLRISDNEGAGSVVFDRPIDVTGTVTSDGLTTSGDLVVNTTGNTPVVWANTTGSGKLSSWNKGGAEKAFITNNGGASFGSNVDVTGTVTADAAAPNFKAIHTNNDYATFGFAGSPNYAYVNWTAGPLKFIGAGSTERGQIDANGNLGLGVVPEAWFSSVDALQVASSGALFGRNNEDNRVGIASNAYETASNTWKRIGNSGSAYANLYETDNGAHKFKVAAAGAADSAINWTTALTIDNSGNVLVGTASLAAIDNTPTVNGIGLRGNGSIMSSVTSGGNAVEFRTVSNGVAGTINCSGTSTSYNTSSDYRLKTDVQPMTGATATLKQLKPVNFEWIADGTRVDGFLAHELGEVIPAAATGTHNGMKDEEYQATPATGDVYTAAIVEVTTESQVMETVETGSYVNLAGETIVETEERGVTTDLVETIVQREDVDGVSTEVEVQVTTKVPTMETVITVPAVAEVIHSADVEQPETLEEGQAWRETTAQVMATRSVPDMQGIDQAKVVPLLVATLQEALARIEALEA